MAPHFSHDPELARPLPAGANDRAAVYQCNHCACELQRCSPQLSAGEHLPVQLHLHCVAAGGAPSDVHTTALCAGYDSLQSVCLDGQVTFAGMQLLQHWHWLGLPPVNTILFFFFCFSGLLC